MFVRWLFASQLIMPASANGATAPWASGKCRSGPTGWQTPASPSARDTDTAQARVAVGSAGQRVDLPPLPPAEAKKKRAWWKVLGHDQDDSGQKEPKPKNKKDGG